MRICSLNLIVISPFWEWSAFCRTISTCWSWNKWQSALLDWDGNDPITVSNVCPILWFQVSSKHIGNFFSWFNRLEDSNKSILSGEPSMLRNGHCPRPSNWSLMLSGNLPRLTQSWYVKQSNSDDEGNLLIKVVPWRNTRREWYASSRERNQIRYFVRISICIEKSQLLGCSIKSSKSLD